MNQWQLGPFTRHDGAIFREVPDLPWAAKHLFNPGAVVRDGKVHLLVRGEDAVGRYAGTSRIGLAVSDDGVDFTLQREPVIAPADDAWLAWEAEGGCEDPRIVETPDGGYVCTYTGFDGRAGTLMVATSDDLRTWTKHGPAFAGTPHTRRASKSGSIVTEARDGRLVAARINGGFWMYWGERMCFGARSDDLVRWTPVQFDATGDAYLQMAQGRWTVNRVPRQRSAAPAALVPADALRLARGGARSSGRAHRRRHRAHLQRREPSRPRGSLAGTVRLRARPGTVRRGGARLVHRT